MHQVDKPTLEYALKHYPDIVGWVGPLHEKDGRPLFNTTKFVTARNTYVSVFSVKPVYYEAIGGYWRPLSEITAHHGNKRIELNDKWRMATPRFIDWLSKRQALFGRDLLLPTPFGFLLRQDLARPTVTLGLTTTTVYPDPNPETTTFDGGIGNIFGSSGTSLSAAESTTTTTNRNDTAIYLQENDYGIGIGYVRAPSAQHYPFRSATLFDTSAIGSDTIDSATLSIATGLSSADGMNDAYGYISVGSVAPASNTGWSAADITFSNWGTTQYATGIDITSWAAVNNYNNFTLNATGEAAINGSGVSKFGFMHGREFENQNWTGGSANSYVRPFSSDNTGTTYDPKLVVEHTAAAGVTFRPRTTIY